MRIRLINSLLILLLCGTVNAQEVIVDFDEIGKVILNQELRKNDETIQSSADRITVLEDAVTEVDLTSDVTGILPIANGGLGSTLILPLDNGGTGQDLSTNNQGDIYFDGGTNGFTRLVPDTAGKVLQTNGAGANPSWGTLASGNVYEAQNGTAFEEVGADTERTHSVTSASYVKFKEITPLFRGGNVTITCEVRNGGNWNYTFKLVRVRNSSETTIQETLVTSSQSSYLLVTESNYSVEPGDFYRMYLKNSLTASMYAKELKVKVLYPMIPQELSGY